jgi:hypothetical protein
MKVVRKFAANWNLWDLLWLKFLSQSSSKPAEVQSVSSSKYRVGRIQIKPRGGVMNHLTEALDFLEPHIRPAWLVPQYRHALDRPGDREYDREGQQQSFRATFTGIRNAVRVLLEVRMDSLARKFHETKDLKVRDEIYRLSRELIKLDSPWEFVAS